jgi:hypothetical protein
MIGSMLLVLPVDVFTFLVFEDLHNWLLLSESRVVLVMCIGI